VGNVERWSETVNTNGPVLFPGLGTTSGERTIVLDHNGSDPQRGWIVYYAYPADRDASCPVVQIEGTDDFTDCEDRVVNVTELSPPTNGEYPVIEDRKVLFIDLGDRPLDPTTTIAG
jgi:hypothetical protein